MSRAYLFCLCVLVSFVNCKQAAQPPSQNVIADLNLKKGQIINCSPANQQFGEVSFDNSCGEKSRTNFNLAISLLHSFEYDEAEKAFSSVIADDPACAMAYWGVAMSNFHPLWTPPSAGEFEKGSKAIKIAQALSKTQRETEYIDALASFYSDPDKKSHLVRCQNFESGMEAVYQHYPNDKEAAIFYSLSLLAAADPADKSFTRQKKAGKILNAIYPGQPNHPGIVHYIIHAYDYPELAFEGLAAARAYAAIAPSSAHALHMPSHIFTRLGLWNESIQSDQASVSSAKCYAEANQIKGHWDEELHGLDYLMYAYLQKGRIDSAKQQLDYLHSISEVHPVNFKVAYAFAAIPSRYVLENRDWKGASDLALTTGNFAWKDFPWQEAIIHFTRVLGSVHTGRIGAAETELIVLNRIHDTLLNQKDNYKANQVAIQIKSAEAWISLKKGNAQEAIELMQEAAEMEDKTEKHPVTPGEVIPARELLGDMLLELNKPDLALEAYETNLQKHPGRFNGLYGAAMAARKSGNKELAERYFSLMPRIQLH